MCPCMCIHGPPSIFQINQQTLLILLGSLDVENAKTLWGVLKLRGQRRVR